MTYYRRQLFAVANVASIDEVVLRPDSLQYSLAIVQRPRRAHLLCPGDDVEDGGPLLIRSCLAANDVNRKLLLAETELGEDSECLVDILLRPDWLVDQVLETSVEKQQYRELV